MKNIALLCAFTLPCLAGSVTVNVAKVGGESAAACSENKTDGTTASCKATFTSGRGAAISSWYSYDTGAYVWMGALHRTVTSSSNITVTARGFFDSEFTSLGTNQGVNVIWTGPASDNDAQPLNVYVDDGFGNYTLAGTVDADTNTSLNIPYQGTPIKIEVEAVKSG